MIVNIRGMSGSGKSTSVQNILNAYPFTKAYCKHKNKNLFYVCTGLENHNPTVILGSYESKHGAKGADLIDNSNQVMLLIRYFDDLGYNVLFESFMYSISNTIATTCMNENRVFSALKLEVPTHIVERQRYERAINAGKSGKFSDNDLRTNPKYIDNCYNKLRKTNDLCFVVNQDNVLDKYFELIRSEEHRVVVDNRDYFNLQCMFDLTQSKSQIKKQVVNELFEF